MTDKDALRFAALLSLHMIEAAEAWSKEHLPEGAVPAGDVIHINLAAAVLVRDGMLQAATEYLQRAGVKV